MPRQPQYHFDGHTMVLDASTVRLLGEGLVALAIEREIRHDAALFGEAFGHPVKIVAPDGAELPQFAAN